MITAPLFINWNPDPSVFGLPIRWYGLLFATAFFLGYRIFMKIYKNEGINTDYLDNLTIWMAVGTILGARLGHCLFYEPQVYLADPIRILKIWEGGLASHGAAIGIILSMYLYSRRISKRSVIWLLDRIVITVALSGLFIRSGNMVNSEIVGNPTQAPWGVIFMQKDQSPPFFYAGQQDDKVEIHISQEKATSPDHFFNVLASTDGVNWEDIGEIPKYNPQEQEFIAHHPNKLEEPTVYRLFENTQLQKIPLEPMDSTDTRSGELFLEPTAGFQAFTGKWTDQGIDLKLTPRPTSTTTYPELLKSYDMKHWEAVKAIELRPNSPPVGISLEENGLKPVYFRISDKSERLSSITVMARHPSQLYEAITYFFIFIFLYWLYWRRKGKLMEGELFGFFLVLVFTARLLIEFTKIAQEHFDNPLPLNMGQLLSIPFILLGIFFLIRSRKVGVVEYPPYGGEKSDSDE